jgi:membrane protein DedA with SNARE-associated domain
MLLNASITGGLVTFATHLINDVGYWGIAGLCAMSALVFVPGTEVTMLFGAPGPHTHHHMTIVGIIIAAIVGDLIGASLAWGIGYLGLTGALERLPGPLKVSPHEMERFDRWFERWGASVVAVSRIIPVIRGAGPYSAGIAKMSYVKAFIATLGGDILWFTGLGLLGDAVGHEWQKWKSHLDYIDYAVGVIIVALVAWWLYTKLWKNRGQRIAGTPVN